jgi:hypothetical protein
MEASMAIMTALNSGLASGRLRPAKVLGNACAYAAFALSVAFTGAVVFGIIS